MVHADASQANSAAPSRAMSLPLAPQSLQPSSAAHFKRSGRASMDVPSSLGGSSQRSSSKAQSFVRAASGPAGSALQNAKLRRVSDRMQSLNEALSNAMSSTASDSEKGISSARGSADMSDISHDRQHFGRDSPPLRTQPFSGSAVFEAHADGSDSVIERASARMTADNDASAMGLQHSSIPHMDSTFPSAFGVSASALHGTGSLLHPSGVLVDRLDLSVDSAGTPDGNPAIDMSVTMDKQLGMQAALADQGFSMANTSAFGSSFAQESAALQSAEPSEDFPHAPGACGEGHTMTHTASTELVRFPVHSIDEMSERAAGAASGVQQTFTVMDRQRSIEVASEADESAIQDSPDIGSSSFCMSGMSARHAQSLADSHPTGLPISAPRDIYPTASTEDKLAVSNDSNASALSAYEDMNVGDSQPQLDRTASNCMQMPGTDSALACSAASAESALTHFASFAMESAFPPDASAFVYGGSTFDTAGGQSAYHAVAPNDMGQSHESETDMDDSIPAGGPMAASTLGFSRMDSLEAFAEGLVDSPDRARDHDSCPNARQPSAGAANRAAESDHAPLGGNDSSLFVPDAQQLARNISLEGYAAAAGGGIQPWVQAAELRSNPLWSPGGLSNAHSKQAATATPAAVGTSDAALPSASNAGNLVTASRSGQSKAREAAAAAAAGIPRVGSTQTTGFTSTRPSAARTSGTGSPDTIRENSTQGRQSSHASTDSGGPAARMPTGQGTCSVPGANVIMFGVHSTAACMLPSMHAIFDL